MSVKIIKNIVWIKLKYLNKIPEHFENITRL